MVCTRSGMKVSGVTEGFSSESDDEDFDVESFQCQPRDEAVTKSKSSRRTVIRKVSFSKHHSPSTSIAKENKGDPSSSTSARKAPKSILKKKTSSNEGLKRSHQGNHAGGDEKFKTRFSAHRIHKHLPFASDREKWIKASGHGSLLSLPDFNVPVRFTKWIMKHIDLVLREFRLDGKVIVFDRALVCKILGFENGTKPLTLSVDVAKYDEFLKIREQFRAGNRAKLGRCEEVLVASKDEVSFMRAFMLLALGAVYCPRITNAVSLKYLHSLHDVSKIKEFDWAGHILDLLMAEVVKYQKLSSEQLERDHGINGCLPIFAIAYMDHLDIPTHRGTHQICYDLPRICNVSTLDFEFAMEVDRDRMQFNTFGRLPFRAVTPYSTAPNPTEGPKAAEAHVHSSQASLADWLHQPGPSNQSSHPVPSQYHPIVTETHSLIGRDIDELVEAMAADFKGKCKGIIMKRLAEMTSKITEAPCTTCNAPPKASTSYGVPAGKGADGTSTSGEGVDATIRGDNNFPFDDIDITEKLSSIVIETVKAGAHLDSSNAKASLSSLTNRDDIPSFNLFKADDPDYKLIYGDGLGKENNSSSFDKKNRKRRADMKLKPKKYKKLKVGQEVTAAYDRYLSKKLKLKNPSPEGSSDEKSILLPPFVSILGFHVTYEDFYESFKHRDTFLIWSCQCGLAFSIMTVKKLGDLTTPLTGNMHLMPFTQTS